MHYKNMPAAETAGELLARLTHPAGALCKGTVVFCNNLFPVSSGKQSLTNASSSRHASR
jgi:hypothetical protein